MGNVLSPSDKKICPVPMNSARADAGGGAEPLAEKSNPATVSVAPDAPE